VRHPMPMTSTIFLLSPASLSGRRGALLRSPDAAFETARRVREDEGAPLGEVFAFVSGLYFRGKLAYARRFARAPVARASTLVITPSRGLLSPDHRATASLLEEFAGVPVDLEEPRYRAPLEASVRTLAASMGRGDRVVLLGSIATDKYLGVLSTHLGRRLFFPGAFVGRGDMSRGGLMLRSASDGLELEYVRVADAERRGPRVARLEPRRRTGVLVP
jgi:hypothetical protein